MKIGYSLLVLPFLLCLSPVQAQTLPDDVSCRLSGTMTVNAKPSIERDSDVTFNPYAFKDSDFHKTKISLKRFSSYQDAGLYHLSFDHGSAWSNPMKAVGMASGDGAFTFSRLCEGDSCNEFNLIYDAKKKLLYQQRPEVHFRYGYLVTEMWVYAC